MGGSFFPSSSDSPPPRSVPLLCPPASLPCSGDTSQGGYWGRAHLAHSVCCLPGIIGDDKCKGEMQGDQVAVGGLMWLWVMAHCSTALGGDSECHPLPWPGYPQGMSPSPHPCDVPEDAGITLVQDFPAGQVNVFPPHQVCSWLRDLRGSSWQC